MAVIGSGPAGLAAAQQLNRAGHSVTVFEKADRIGGLLRYGIPDFKLGKNIVDRRLHQMEQEGVEFKPGVHVGADVKGDDLRKEFDVLLLAGGAENPRELNVPGRELKGIHFAMEYLPQQNRRVAGDRVPGQILATGKRVAIIGGGDTGADCLGTAHRQKAHSVHQFEIMPMPPSERSPQTPWPLWPLAVADRKLARGRWHARMGRRHDSFQRRRTGQRETVARCPRGAAARFERIPGTEFTLDVDLVLLAMGFTGPVRNGLLEQLDTGLDARGNVATDENYMTSVPGVFAAGDLRRGQSLVVWAIREGRQAARAIDLHLMGKTCLR